MANEKRLIDANELLESKWWDSIKDDFDKARAKIIVQSCHTVDAVEVVHGRWRRFINGDGEYKYLCSVCGKMVTYEMGGSNYCPNCGAKMDGDGNENKT